MPQKKQPFTNKISHFYAVLAFIVVLGLIGFGGYYVGAHKNNTAASSSQNRPGYVAAQEAREQVDNFYAQYIQTSGRPESQRKILASYGSRNLEFYNDYYQHGFNPITCSPATPVKVTVLQATAGPTAKVTVRVEQPDGQDQTLVATVVVNDQGLKIDSIACSGDRGNLPPSTQD